MRKATEKDVQTILDHLKPEVENCLYMFIDITCYGTNQVDVWFDETDGTINWVVMKYHGSFQLYSASPESVDVTGIRDLINEYYPAMISGRRELIERIRDDYEDTYFEDGGFILRLNNFVSVEDDEFKVEVADKSDVDELSRLISGDPYYSSSYSYEEISEQLTERMETGMGVSFIIRKDGMIIAHNSITAQVDDICIAGMLLIHQDWRQSNAALVIERFIVDYAKDRGKRLFGFSTEPRRRKQFEMMGNNIVAEYRKLIKRPDARAEA